MAAASSNASRPANGWIASDDEILMTARAAGLSWQPISQKYFPNKTANACRKRHERLMEQRNADELDGVKFETLATTYMQVRQQMWSILGDQLGEKWTVVEAKCMEKGLKNLNSAYRSAQRKERGNSEEGDSGIDVQDAENDIDDSPSSTHQAPFTQGGYQGHRAGMSIQTMLSPSPHAGPSRQS